ncbi:transcription initiation factor TFIID subunit 2 isoform X2 [Euphorbia lathyris]|uniref:transcription initiation factor TFIID subunit 2 isoform X2 n=1 Tax=Euphorbia lathyris TaxID=212925 RepID=UPI003313B372
MAKPRKPKNEDPKPENSGAVVRHQKLCLSVDMDKRQIYGYTELEIIVPDIGIVGLHAENLGIENVFVDGEPTEFEYYPHQHNAVESDKRWNWVSNVGSAADAAGSAYVSALSKELVPNLLINCCKAFRVPNEQQDQMNLENGDAEAKQNVKLVRINYWVEKSEAGIHFKDNVLHTDNQIRRARCWFPCVDEGSQRCCYDLEFTVAHHLVAVSTGNLLYQVLSKDDFPRKTFVYRLDIPVTAQWISLVVAPFEILPDPHVGFVSHMCLSAHLSKLRNTVEFFHHAFNYYEEYLDAKFPFGSYTQIFLSPEVVVSSSSLGASISIFSSQVLYDERVIDQTIDTSIKLAFALAKQWFGVYIVPEEPNDEWLLDGLAGFLTDLFIKKFLGNNEARYRRYKANCAVCKADDSGATALSSSASCKDLYGTHCIGISGKIRSWKSVAILQMLEKQMGPESFRKILQKVVSRAQDTIPMRSLSTKEFRHFATKVGNLERPFLKEFFPRWVCSCGCPILRMGFSYNKRKNMVELAVLRECTAIPDASISVLNLDSDNREGEIGWPGMMSIRVYELDGMYDHPILPLAGETWQLLEIQCHSKLAARRVQKSKKGSKPDGSDENGDTVPVADLRSSLESPLLWIRADPEMEYLAEIHFNQPVQMWINQLEKDEDVVAQAQAIAALEALPQLSFSVINALNNFLSDSKAFWRVRIEAAFALATTASEGTDWSGLLHLVKFYKSRRFDTTIGLPKQNDFHDFPEYFVLESIPQAVAMVRAADNKSPREAIDFVLQLLKYNDNTGNPYSDVFWLAALVQSVGQLEFGQQDHVFYLIKPHRDFKTVWQIRIAASRALLDLEYHCSGIDSALSLFIIYLKEESTLRGQVKLTAHAMRLCQIQDATDSKDDIKSSTLVALLSLLESHLAFNNTYLRHYLFCILQILAGRVPTLYGVPRDKTICLGDAETCGEPKNIFVPLVPETEHVAPSVDGPNLNLDAIGVPHAPKEPDRVSSDHQHAMDLVIVENAKEPDTISSSHEPKMDSVIQEALKETDTVSQNQERKMPVVKIRVRRSAASSRGEETDNQTLERTRGGHRETDRGASSSISVDAPRRNSGEAASGSNQNVEEVNSCLDRGSRMTASIGSAKLASDGDNFGKELQCTAESSKVVHPRLEDLSSPSMVQDNNVDTGAQRYASLQTLSVGRLDRDVDNGGVVVSPRRKDKGKKKDKEKKRKQEDHKGRKSDPEYLERKRLKKEKKRKEKELAKLLLSQDVKTLPAVDLPVQKQEPSFKLATVQVKPSESSGSKLVNTNVEPKTEMSEGNSAPRFRIKIKNRTLNK